MVCLSFKRETNSESAMHSDNLVQEWTRVEGKYGKIKGNDWEEIREVEIDSEY